jgi:hypothetical protein
LELADRVALVVLTAAAAELVDTAGREALAQQVRLDRLARAAAVEAVEASAIVSRVNTFFTTAAAEAAG